jgi:hypothetical protein
MTDTLVERLSKFVKHTNACAYDIVFGHGSCTCGLTKTMADLEALLGSNNEPERKLKRSWHEATFMRGQTEPAAKHLFDAIHNYLKVKNNGNRPLEG